MDGTVRLVVGEHIAQRFGICAEVMQQRELALKSEYGCGFNRRFLVKVLDEHVLSVSTTGKIRVHSVQQDYVPGAGPGVAGHVAHNMRSQWRRILRGGAGPLEAEVDELLRLPILQHREIVAREIGDRTAMVIGGNHIQNYQACAGPDDALRLQDLALGLLWRWGLGKSQP